MKQRYSRGDEVGAGLITTREQWDSIPSADYDVLKGGPLIRQRTGLAPLGAGADWHMRFEIQHLRLSELALDLDRNDLVIGQGVTRFVDNVLQGGPRVEPKTGNDEVDSILRDGWQEWCGDKYQCHFLQTQNWSEMRETSLRAAIVQGDMFQVMMSNNSADLMESHRARKPLNTTRNVVFGILKDESNRPRQVWFTKENIQPTQQLNNVSATNPVDIRDSEDFEQVMHLVQGLRATQTRGVTKFACMFKAATLHDDTLFAQLVNHQVQSCITLLRQQPPAINGLPSPETGTAGDVEIADDDEGQRIIQKLAPGLEIAGKPGEIISAFTPQMAGVQFWTFERVILMFLAINLNVPLPVLLLDASEGNFANMRGILMQARITWQKWQRWQVDHQERPTYFWRVRALLEERSPRGERLRALVSKGDVNLYQQVWHLPEWEYIDPLKDVSAGALELATGQSSPRRVAARQQVDFNHLAREIVDDRGMLMELAVLKAFELNQKLAKQLEGQNPIPWEVLAPMGLPNGVTMQIGAGAGGGGESDSKTNSSGK